MLQTYDLAEWQSPVAPTITTEALFALETGKVIYLPKLAFDFLDHEQIFLATQYSSPKSKNISYHPEHIALQGAICTKTEHMQLCRLMQRYAVYCKQLVCNLLPEYKNLLQQGRISFRPIEIMGRKPASYRKDDTRLHVDAFPATPMLGKRILRVFTNVNPDNKPRVWRLGAPFPKVVEYFHRKLRKPFQGTASSLYLLKITKEKRTLYDHYMLQLHNAMKADEAYQQQVPQLEFQFPSGSSWIVYTDQVSHAAMSGQYVLEQTFYLPGMAIKNADHSPQAILEKHLQRKLL